MGVLNRKSDYFNKVRQALIKLANIIDPSSETIQNDSFYEDVSESLEKIANGYSDSSFVLPSVTSEDDGKALVVTGGKWGTGDGGGAKWYGTQEEYDALATYDADTMYYIYEE